MARRLPLLVLVLAASCASPAAPDPGGAPAGPPAGYIELPGIDGLGPQAALDKISQRIARFAAYVARSEGRPDVSPGDITQAVELVGTDYQANGIRIDPAGGGIKVWTAELLDHHGQPVSDGHSDHTHDAENPAELPAPRYVCPGLADDHLALVSARACAA